MPDEQWMMCVVIAMKLRPGVLEHLGLKAAVEQIAEDINQLNLFNVEVQVEGVESEMPEEVKLDLSGSLRKP